MTRFTIAVLSLLLCGCATRLARQTPPQWVLAPGAVYSSDRYLTAVGEGDTLGAAETHALSRMAGRFETRVQSSQQLSDQVAETFGQKHEFERQSDYQSSIHLQTDQTLLNTKTARQFQDATGRVYVLVVLDRLETAQIYEQTIAENAQRIASLMNADPSKLVAYAKAQRALELGLNNQMLIAQLAIIHPIGSHRIGLPYKLEQLRQRLAQAIAAVRFHVSLVGDRSEPLEQQIRALMTARGFTAHWICDLCITGTLSIGSMNFLRQDIRTVRYRVLVNMKGEDGHTLLAMQKEGRESHITEQEAYRRAERTVHQLVEKELLGRLDILVENLAGK